MNDVLRIARLKIALQRAFLGRAILIFTVGTIHQKAVHELDSTAQGTQCVRALLHLRQNATDTKAPMVASGSHDRAQTCKLYPRTKVTDRAKQSKTNRQSKTQ